MFFAVALIIVGIMLIFNKMGLVTGDIWGWIWPVLIIILGISMMFRKRCACESTEIKEKK